MKIKHLVLTVAVVMYIALGLVSCDKEDDPNNNNNNNNNTPTTFVDTRDSQVYPIVKIGTQTWMKKNLNYETASGSYVYKDKPENAAIYGRLYKWEVACTVCPDGWHLPSMEEFQTLINYLGGWRVAGKALKDTSTIYWSGKDALPSTNSSGFSALPAGYWGINIAYNYSGLHWYTTFMTSTDSINNMYPYVVDLYDGWDKAFMKAENVPTTWFAYSVRCIKD